MDVEFWFCCTCNGEPMGIWQNVCTGCNQKRCHACLIERTNGLKPYDGGSYDFNEGYIRFVGRTQCSLVPHSQSHRSTVYPKQTPDAAQSGSKKDVQSTEDAESSSEKRSMSMIEDEESKDEQKDGQRLMTNHPHKPEIEPKDRRERHEPKSQARPTQGDAVLVRHMDTNRPDIAQRADVQALPFDADSDNEMEIEPHTEHKTLDPDTYTADRRASLRRSESQFDPSPISPPDKKFSRSDSYRQHERDHQEHARLCLCKHCRKYWETNGFKHKDYLMRYMRNYHHIDDLSTSPDSGINPLKRSRSFDIPHRVVYPIVEKSFSPYPNNDADVISEHLDWAARNPSRLISTYTSKNFRETSNIERTSILDTNLVEDGDDDIDRYYPETIPASPSCASSVASVFSVGSLASSATGLSRSSGYSAVQIASATKVLLSVLQEDASLLSLYKNAMNNPYIGPDRLRRNLRRIFKAYSKQLENEAKERLEFLTSRLVMKKSGLLADSIVEKLQKAQVTHSVSDDKHKYESSDEEEDESSGAYPVNEEAFEDLEVFREFLVKSEAFQNLHTQVQVFVTGKSTQTADTSIMENKKLPAKDAVRQCLALSATQARSLTWENWVKDVTQTIDGLLRHTSMTNTANAMMFLFADAFMLATDGIFVALGQLEPPLKPGMTRLRWRCNCGDRLYSDILELYAGGIFELTGHMQRTSGTKVHVSSYNQQSSGQQYIVPRPGQWTQNAWRKIRAALSRPTQPQASLPQHNTQCHSNASSAPNNQPHQEIIHLMACMHRNRVRICLNQDRIEGVTTDRTLLCFLRRQYMRHRGSILHLVSLKTITGLWFVKFWLPIGGSVSIRYHERCCVAASSASMLCECIPPAPKVEPSPGAEYRCIPGPPATYPPIPPEYLSSLITCPTDVHEKDTWILDQLPKRTCGELQGQIGKPAEGWGVYYQEGWDRDVIALVILVILVTASLLFGILWSRYHFDIQGAFGVSAYIIALGAVLIHVVSNQADKAG